jgi:hypothetical protein
MAKSTNDTKSPEGLAFLPRSLRVAAATLGTQGSLKGLKVNAIRPPRNPHLRLIRRLPSPPHLPGAKAYRRAKRLLAVGASAGFALAAATLQVGVGLFVITLCSLAAALLARRELNLLRNPESLRSQKP